MKAMLITYCICHSFPLRRRTSHTLALLQHGGSSHRTQSPPASPVRVLSTGCSPSGRSCSSWSPAGSQVPQRTCSTVEPSLHGSTGPARSLLQSGLPKGAQPLLGIHLLQHGALQGYRCFPMDLHRWQGHSCLTMLLTWGCRGISALMPVTPLPFLLH